MTPLHNARWRKSSYSNNAAGCVELAILGQAMAVRDSKHPTGPVLTFPNPAIHALLHRAELSR